MQDNNPERLTQQLFSSSRAVIGPGSETSPLKENYPVTSGTLQA